jgi:hypothetical protein
MARPSQDGLTPGQRIAALETENARLRTIVGRLEDELLMVAAKLSAAESILERAGVIVPCQSQRGW